MSKEMISLNLNNPESQEKEPKIKRSNIIRALALVGLMGVVEACGGLRPEDIEKIPLTAVEQIAENPEQYAQVILKTSGYPEVEKKRKLEILVNRSETSGGGFIMMPPIIMPTPGSTTNKTEWTSLDNEVLYKIHESADLQSPYIEAMAPEKEYISNITTVEQVDTSMKLTLDRGQKTQVVGNLEKVRDGDKEIFILRIININPEAK